MQESVRMKKYCKEFSLSDALSNMYLADPAKEIDLSINCAIIN